MRFSPLRAGTIFGAISVAPALLLVLLPAESIETNLGPIWLVAVAVMLSGAVAGSLFGFGARLSRRKHKLTSLAFSAALFFAMTYSLNALLSDMGPESGFWNGALFYSLLSIYTVAAGWRFAPREEAATTDASIV